MKPKECLEARRLRQSGQSLKRIAAMLGVSPSSVSRWTIDIKLSGEQQQKLLRRNPGGGAGAASRRKKALLAREVSQECGHTDCAEFSLHLAGCMLYWAEGAKKRNTVGFSNSDPAMVRLFMRFLRECFAVDDDRFRLQIHCYLNNGLSQEEVEAYWLAITGLSRKNLTKTQVNKISKASKQVAKPILYGVCRVCLNDTVIVQRIYGSIQCYAGFSQRTWLW